MCEAKREERVLFAKPERSQALDGIYEGQRRSRELIALWRYIGHVFGIDDNDELFVNNKDRACIEGKQGW